MEKVEFQHLNIYKWTVAGYLGKIAIYQGEVKRLKKEKGL